MTIPRTLVTLAPWPWRRIVEAWDAADRRLASALDLGRGEE